LAPLKRIEFVGDSLERIRRFPESPRKEAGVQLHKVQLGLEPSDWKPMAAVGSGAREIRVQDEAGAFRVMYVAHIAGAIYVLHAFQKKTQQTPLRDIELAAKRLKQLLKDKS
jgi:phage-related protein